MTDLPTERTAPPSGPGAGPGAGPEAGPGGAPGASGGGLPAAVARVVLDLLTATHTSRADDVATLAAGAASGLGAGELVVYLVDYEQVHLCPLPGPVAGDQAPLRIDGTVAGRAFTSLNVQDVRTDEPGRRRLWLPLLDGTDRLGVVGMTFPEDGEGPWVDPSLVPLCERLAHLVAHLIVAKSAYGDVFELVRRRRPMTVAAELQYKLLPPATFATRGLVLTASVEPAYTAGGDSFDYAVNGRRIQFAVFDAMGHGLSAAVTATVAVSAYRNGRRLREGLADTYATVHEALLEEFAGDRFATAVLAELDLDTGLLSWMSAGHPPPLLLRRGRLVKTLQAEPHPPLGVPFVEPPTAVRHEHLEPGDRLLVYTDGLTEARTTDGSFFTVERLAEFLERQAAAGLPAPETLRRLRHAVLGHQGTRLQDDATAVLLEWGPGAERALVHLDPLRSPGLGPPDAD